ncbi:MAG: helix-turn-helix transcriptional regulator [Candidatus Thorarchaeota archaeon]
MSSEVFERRSFSMPILAYLMQEEEMPFGKLQAELKVSKRTLYLTLSDLEREGLIRKIKRGRHSVISITGKGQEVLLTTMEQDREEEDIVNEIVTKTITQLEEEGVLKPTMSQEDKDAFVKKLKKSIFLRGTFK